MSDGGAEIIGIFLFQPFSICRIDPKARFDIRALLKYPSSARIGTDLNLLTDPFFVLCTDSGTAPFTQGRLWFYTKILHRMIHISADPDLNSDNEAEFKSFFKTRL